MSASPDVVLLTDRAWPDDAIERELIEKAGLRLVSGPPEALPAEKIEQLVSDCSPLAIMTCWAQVTGEAITRATRLRSIARMGVGLDNINVQAATGRGVQVTNVPDYCVEEVSDHAVGLILNWSRGITVFDRDVRAGAWRPQTARLRRLSAQTVGIVGYGRIGRATTRKLRALGCRVLVSTPHPPHQAGIEFTTTGELLARSDIVVLHVPLTPGTYHLVGPRELETMRPGAFLVNVSRGGLVDTDALIRALDAGRLAGAALDVLEAEPEVDTRLTGHPAVTVTPHVAFSSDESVTELRVKATEEVLRVLSGEPPRYPCNAPHVGATGTIQSGKE
jgi:D-3-phosphoglycerate dehydrogenase